MKNNLELFNNNLENGYLNQSAYENITNKKINKNDSKINNGDIISVIIPTYNRKNQLKECIDSILLQTYKNFEIIIVDDRSTDNTKEFIEKNYSDNRIKYFVNEKNSGAGTSRRNGYKKSKGKYIIFCDDDDYYIDPLYFENAIKILEDDKISIICSNAYIKYEVEEKYTFNELNLKEITSAQEYLKYFQYKYNKPLSTFTAVFRKEILNKSDFENMQMMNDSSIYLRALLKSEYVYYNKQIIGVYSVHSKNISFNIKSDFLIENLEEKYYVYNNIINNKIFENTKEWLESQVNLTVNYYISGSNPEKKELSKIIDWMKEKQLYKCIKNAKITKLKTNIKTVIKKLIRRNSK